MVLLCTLLVLTGNTNAGEIVIDLSTQTMVFKNQKGEEVVAKVSTGTPQTPTPTGTFKVASKTVAYKHQGARKAGRDVTIPYWLELGGDVKVNGRGIAIHHFGKAFGGGYPASGGCIRVVDAEMAKAVSESSAIGDKVVIKGSEKEFLTKADSYWKDPKIAALFTNPEAGQGEFILKRPGEFTPEMVATLQDLFEARRVGFYRPKPAQVRADKRWGQESNCFLGFPRAQKNPTDCTFDEASRIYLRLEEVERLFGRKLTVVRGD